MMTELDRFQKKAKEYSTALKKSPKARLFELYPVLQLLHMYCNSVSKSKSKLKIVDLMSGTGFLAENLYNVGFSNIVAIEFCDAMSDGSDMFGNKIVLKKAKTFEDMAILLNEIKPDVVVSLAAFHHLISYDTLGNVDFEPSCKQQKNIIDICLSALEENGMLIITDLSENEVEENVYPRDVFAMKAALNDLKKLGVQKPLLKKLVKCLTISDTSKTISSEFLQRNKISKNLSLNWFRNFVDKNAEIGHKDIAISNRLCSSIKNNMYCVSKFYCPWMFKNEEELQNFVEKKFAFSLNSTEKKQELNLEEDINSCLGIRQINEQNVIFLGWNLAVLAVWKKCPFESSKLYHRLLFCLVSIIILLIILNILRVCGASEKLSMTAILLFFCTLPLSILFSDFVDRLALKSSQQKNTYK